MKLLHGDYVSQTLNDGSKLFYCHRCDLLVNETHTLALLDKEIPIEPTDHITNYEAAYSRFKCSAWELPTQRPTSAARPRNRPEDTENFFGFTPKNHT
jgi:hypothetical protein